MIVLDLSILNQKGTPMFNSDTFANRPTFGIVGRIFISTDTKEFYRDTGTSWELIGGPGSGTITGSGTTGTLSKFTSASSIGNSIVTEGTGLITITGSNSRLVVSGTDDGSSQIQTYFDGNTRLKFVAASNIATDDADITGFRARGTNAIKLAIQSGDSITNYSGRGYDGINFNGGAGFDIFAAENFTSIANGSYISIETTPIGSTTPTYFHRFSANGGFHVGQNTDPAGGFIFQTNGNANFIGYGSFQSTSTAANNASSVAIIGVNTLSYAAAFSSNNIGAIYGAITGFNLQTFAGSATFANSNVASGGSSVNSIDFSSGGSTITMTQSSGIRVMSGQQNLFQYQGTNSGTITHAAISQNTGFYRPNAATGILTITNAYSHLINALDDYGAGFTFTNRWGIYQAGASDKNYFAANMLLGSTTDNGNRLQVNGNGYISGNVGVGSTTIKNWSAYKALQVGLTGALFSDAGSTETFLSSNIYYDGSYKYISNERAAALTLYNGAFVFSNAITGTSGNSMTLIDRLTILQNGETTITSTGINVVNFNSSFGQMAVTLQNSGVNFANIGSGNSVSSSGTFDDLGIGTAGLNKNIIFATGTGYATRLTITGGGNLLVGTTTDSGQKLYLNGSLRIDGQSSGTSGGNSGQHLIINLDGTTYKIKLENP